MGLIREVQGVSASLNKTERARRERERLKILQENYKKELESDLKAEFYGLFNTHDSDGAYIVAVTQKDYIIEKLYNIISKITYTENGKKYLTYSKFDIVGDLQENYFKILDKIKKEFARIENINKNELLKRLENKLERLFDLTNNKYCASIVAKEKDMVYKIINDVAQNETEKKTLKDNYSRVLNKVIRLYDGNIKMDKIEMKHKKEVAKTKQNKKVFNQILWGHLLSDINKSIPKGFSKGKGR